MNSLQMHQSQLSIVEPATETHEGKTVSGVLILSQAEDNFFICWNPLGSPTQNIIAVFEAQGRNEVKVEDWTPCKPFKIDCQKLSTIRLDVTEKEQISVELKEFTEKESDAKSRTFNVNISDFTSLSEFIEILLVKGIAVPYDKEKYALFFYKKCHKGVFNYTPTYIQLQFSEYESLDKFWDNVHKYYQELIIHLDKSDSLPKDPLFPLGVAARAAHKRVFDEIEKSISSQPTKYEKVTEIFDEEGNIKDKENFRKRVYYSGIDHEKMAEALPFIFGVYTLDQTKEEREKQKEEQVKEFNTLWKQVENLQDDQIKNNKKLTGFFRVISHDISRTDRQTDAFKEVDKPGLTMLSKLLRTYCVFNPPISYLQGMNDLFVPIILAYMPKWTEDGQPVTKDGQPIDYESLLPDIFWCFDSMLRNTNHISFLSSVTEHCQKQAEIVHKIMTEVSPLAAIWMRRNNLAELLWCYSDFVLLFKRSFPENIWSIWLKLNCSEDPKHWLSYFVAAIMMKAFEKLSELPDVTIPTVMDKFPKIMAGLDHDSLGLVACWLYENAKTLKITEEKKEESSIEENFEFFHPCWLCENTETLENAEEKKEESIKEEEEEI